MSRENWILVIVGIIALIIAINLLIDAIKPACSPDALIIKKLSDQICTAESNANKTIYYNYSIEVYPQGKYLLESEINKILTIPETDAKINEILEWEYQNKTWINPQYVGGFPCINSPA